MYGICIYIHYCSVFPSEVYFSAKGQQDVNFAYNDDDDDNNDDDHMMTGIAQLSLQDVLKRVGI